MPDISYDILRCLGILSTEKGGWRKELNLISWNGQKPKLDLRSWAPDHDKMGKGVTLTHEEGALLRQYLDEALQKE
jgi:hypothetical protein